MRLSPVSRPLGLRRAAALAASALLVLGSSLQAGPQDKNSTGTIKGRLVWAAGAVPTPKVEVVKGQANVKDAVCKVKEIVSKDLMVDPATKGVADAFAYISKPAGDVTAAEEALLKKTPEVVIDQVNCEFVPYVTVVHKDQKLKFKSSDPVGHNVRFQTFANGSANQMLPPNGSLVHKIEKGERRPTPIACDIHPWMKGYFLILEHPFATVTKRDGSFEISGIPAGAQNLVLWQSTRGNVNPGGSKGMPITVKAGETVDVGEVKITTK